MKYPKVGRLAPVAIPLALALVVAMAPTAGATTAAQVCALAGNSCAAGVANINVVSNITDGSILDFRTAGFPTVNVNAGGSLKLATKTTTTPECPLSPTTTMQILAGDLTIKGGGSVTGDTPPDPSGRVNGGSIWIDLNVGANSTGNLKIEPNGRLDADRNGDRGSGRGGSITVTADGQIWVQGGPAVGAPRGIISANAGSSSGAAFDDGCGRTEITLLAQGTGHLGGPAGETVRIDGTVEIISADGQGGGGGERFLGGIITVMAGSAPTQLTLPPFPTAHPPVDPAAPLQNPPLNSGAFLLTESGILNVQAKDGGGAEVHIYDCFAVVRGLILIGQTLTEHLAKENTLPNLLSITSNETTVIENGGKLDATLRQGFKIHKGQGPLCAFDWRLLSPNQHGPATTEKGGSDICLISRSNVSVDGALVSNKWGLNATAFTLFAVENNTTGGAPQAKGGATWVVTTELGDATFAGTALTADGKGNGAQGGMIVIQSDNNVKVMDALSNQGTIRVVGDTGGPASGGMLTIQAVNGGLMGFAGGLLLAGGKPLVNSCVAISGFPPAVSTPSFNPPAAPTCGVPQFIVPVPVLLPCTGGCFCLSSFTRNPQTGILTVKGEDLLGVTRVDTNATSCNPNSGTLCGIITQTADTITCNSPALISGRRIVLSGTNAPSSSCSNPIP